MYAANDDFAVLAIAHITESLGHYGLLMEGWDDVGWLTSSEGRKQPFAPPLHPPCNYEAPAKRLVLFVGYSLNTMSVSSGEGRKSARPNASQLKPILPGTSPLKAMRKRHLISNRQGLEF